jgi:hypothetical protein
MPDSNAVQWALFLGFGLLVSAIVPSAAAATDLSGTVTLNLTVASTTRAGDSLNVRTRRKMAKRAVPRIEKRLRAAGFKHLNAETRGNGNLYVEVGTKLSPMTIMGFIVPEGRFEVRPIRSVGALWQQNSTRLPDGAELRQPEGSMARSDAYVWAPKRSDIKTVAGTLDLGVGLIRPYPEGDGWRTLVLGDPVLANSDVQGAGIRPGHLGEPFVSVSLKGSAADRLRSGESGPDTRWAVLLDGEVVTVLDREPTSSGVLNLSPPDHLDATAAQRRWARQVAARISTPMPVRLVSTD